MYAHQTRVLLLGILLIAVTVTLARKFSSRLMSGKPIGENASATNSVNDASLVADNHLSGFTRWITDDNGDGKVHLSCAIRRFDEDPSWDGSGETLSIFNDQNATVYSEKFTRVFRIYPENALRGDYPQLVLEVSNGGNENCLEILDYREGKVIDLTTSMKGENCFDAYGELRPQFRTSVRWYAEPFQLFLTSPGVGSRHQVTRVFRYKDGAYKAEGEFSQQTVDDFIEHLI